MGCVQANSVHLTCFLHWDIKKKGQATVSRSAEGGELCLCLTSMHLRLEEAHNTDFLWHPKKKESKNPLVSSSYLLAGVFPLLLECKDLQPHRTAAPPTLPLTPCRVCRTIVYLKCSVQAFFANGFMLLWRWNHRSMRLFRAPVFTVTLQLDAARDFALLWTFITHFLLMGLKSGDLVCSSTNVFVSLSTVFFFFCLAFIVIALTSCHFFLFVVPLPSANQSKS